MTMTTQFSLSRRTFLVASAAGGLSLGLAVPFAGDAAAEAAGQLPEVNAWVVIRPDDTVVIRIGRQEMGQGTLTGLAQIVAEELECDWSKVTTEYPTPGENVARERVWGDFGTAGSRGIRASHQYMREGGAAARMMLVQAAANRWGVDASACSAANSVITGPAGQSATYGEVAEDAAKLAPPAEVALKDPSEWKLIGQSVKRLDTVGKIDGSQVYSIDHTMEGMLNAAIRRAPVFGAKVDAFDAAAVSGMPGVKHVLQVGEDAVAVVADTWWRAKTALDALPVTWTDGAATGYDMARIHAMLEEGLTAEEAFVGNQQGDVTAAIDGAAQVVEATYHMPYQHHVTLEPMNATAVWTPERCEVWTATQNAEAALAAASEASGLPIESCDVHRINLGGGFGRRATMQDYVTQAVLIAKQVPGTPVKMIWSREEDMLHGVYHPITMCKMTGALDADGNLSGLRMRISGQSILAGVRPQALREGMDPIMFQGLNPDGEEGRLGYTIPNLLVDHAMRNPPVTPGFWRGVCNNQNAYYLECFLDELAHAAGRDPLEFRRAMMADHPKHLAVLNAVADGIGWDTPAPEGVHRGICQHMGYGSYVAAAAEVSVDDRGRFRIHRIVAATDCGTAVNPQQIAAQIEGSFAYGLSASIFGEITITDGKVDQENLDTYRLVSMYEMPAVESIVIPSGGFWGGVGEPTIFVATPAVVNALFAATGKRIRSLPMERHGMQHA
jgi:isoquinoline 1-oxidoreductase subunit beta